MEINTDPTVKKTVSSIFSPYLLMLSLFLMYQPASFSQHKGSITGRIVLMDGKPLDYASIALQQVGGTSTKGALSDSLGHFNFSSVPHGDYRIKVMSMGYQPFSTEVFSITAQKNSIQLGNLRLSEDATLLNAVHITAHKKLIEQGIDRTILNIENSILAEGNTALELLERAPGVKVDEDGKISLKGRPGVSVMINGKATYLSPQELSTLLKGTNSASISKIEILNNPSAKYDAAGNAGIINIVLKKNTASGFNGSVALNSGYSRNARYGSGLNLNYRNERFNMYGSYNYGYRGETEYLDFVRRFYESGIASGNPDRTSNQHTKTNEPLHTHNFRVGMDYNINKSNSIGFLINGNTGKYTHDSRTENQLSSNQGVLLSNTSTSNYDRQHWENLTYNLNYLHKFDKEGREFTADADFASNSFTSDLNLDTRTLASSTTPGGSVASRRGYIPAKTDVYIGKIDYTEPLGKSAKLESGLKSSVIHSDNNLKYDVLTNGNWVPDKTSSNHFRYKEQIHAGYLNFQKEFKHFNIQAGLRGEYTRTQGHQITSDSLLNRNYFQLFPSLFVNKPFGKEHELQAAYSRRIERPDYGDLNPFKVFRDPLLFYQGNPFLKPQLTNTFQLSHSLKGKYTTAISYNHTKDVITWVTGQIDNLNTTFESPQNLRSLTNYGISFTASTQFLSWWTGTHFGNVFRNKYEGDGKEGAFNNQIVSFSLNTQNTFKAGKGYSMELNAFYNAKSVYGISTEKAYYSFSAGMQKTILKEKGSLKLMANDIFQTSQYRQRTLYENIDMNTHVRPDSRRVMLSFSYRFGNQNMSKKERKTGSEDIQNRVKSGG